MTAPATDRAAGQLIVVGVADMRASRDAAASLVTYALGSCLGLAVHDPAAGVAGLLHLMLPTGSIDPAKAEANPHMFCDTGVPALFRACYALGARKERMVVKVAGGTVSGDGSDHFQIGKRNVLTLRKLLWKNGVLLQGEEVGGLNVPRTMRLDVATGTVTLTTQGASRVL
jgi:chemotaxis protein CheD